MRNKYIVVAAGAISAMLALSGCGSSGGHANHENNQSGAASSPAAAAASAETIYKSNCMSCHGGNLEGKMGPGLQKVGGKLSKEQIAAKIQNGGGGMPTFKSKLKDEDIQALSVWLAEKK